MRALSIVGLVISVLAAVGLYRDHAIIAQGWIGIAIQLAAVLLMVWARVTFGRRSFHAAANPTAGGLVTRGPYRYIRHPIYAAILYFTWAAVLTNWHPLTLALGAVVTVGLGARIWAEERFLRATYPEYAEYAAATRRVIPGLI